MAEVHKTGSIKLTEFPVEVQKLLKEFDTDNSNGINVSELSAMINAYKDMKRQRRFLQVILAVVSFALLLSSASTFGVSYAAVELAKDFEPNTDGVMVVISSQSGETRPALSPEPTITDGIEIEEIEGGLWRRLQQNVSQEVVRVITITESRVAQACRLFHQGAASHMVVTIDDQNYRVSPTRFHRSCMTASGSYDDGTWSVSCPGEQEACNVSLEMRQSQGERRLERALMGKMMGGMPMPMAGGMAGMPMPMAGGMGGMPMPMAGGMGGMPGMVRIPTSGETGEFVERVTELAPEIAAEVAAEASAAAQDETFLGVVRSAALAGSDLEEWDMNPQNPDMNMNNPYAAFRYNLKLAFKLWLEDQ